MFWFKSQIRKYLRKIKCQVSIFVEYIIYTVRILFSLSVFRLISAKPKVLLPFIQEHESTLFIGK
jgi:hypothetical protein